MRYTHTSSHAANASFDGHCQIVKGIVYAWMGLHQDVFLYFYKFAIQLFKWHFSKKYKNIVNRNLDNDKVSMTKLIPLNRSLMKSKYNMFVQWQFQDE